MKILLIDTSEQTGGAAIACNRLMHALRKENVDAHMLVRDKSTEDKNVFSINDSGYKKLLNRFHFVWERFVIWINNGCSRKNLFAVSIGNTGFDVTRLKVFQDADIVHLHWINQGMLSLHDIGKILYSGKPVVWTMHDMWEITSICHHAYTCEKFKTECYSCPFLRFPNKWDLSYRVFCKKRKIYKQARINIVPVSTWLEKQVVQSSLLGDQSVSVIPNTISVEDFLLLNKMDCRKELSLPVGKKVIVFGAARIDDPIKGFDTLLEALRLLIEQKRIYRENFHLILFGTIRNLSEILSEIPITYSYFGLVKQVKLLNTLYSASDIVVSASHYETFGQTIIEALACGCLPVTFGNSGQSDIITHKQNGYLAKQDSVEDLAQGILWAFSEGEKISQEKLRNYVVERYAASVVAQQYINLYKSLL